MRLLSTRIKRNAPCPCGSGKKIKHCCIQQIKELQQAANAGISPVTVEAARILQEKVKHTVPLDAGRVTPLTVKVLQRTFGVSE